MAIPDPEEHRPGRLLDPLRALHLAVSRRSADRPRTGSDQNFAHPTMRSIQFIARLGSGVAAFHSPQSPCGCGPDNPLKSQVIPPRANLGAAPRPARDQHLVPGAPKPGDRGVESGPRERRSFDASPQARPTPHVKRFYP